MFSRRILRCLVFVVFFMLQIISVYADEGACFSVSGIIPQNQLNKNITYFNLKVNPSDTQELKVKIFNNKKHQIKVKAMVNPATTCRNGFICYTESANYDESLRSPLSDILKLSQSEYIVPAESFVIASAVLNVPNEAYDGIILGGLVFTKVENNLQDIGTNQSSTKIQNNYQYVIGTMLSENDDRVIPNIELKYIKASLINYHTALAVNLQNNRPIIMSELNISTEIYKNGSQEIYRSSKAENASMAPNSNFDFMVGWENYKFDPGDYRAHIIVQNKDYFREWNEYFTINLEEADNINNNAVDLVKNIPFWIYGILISTLLILCILSAIAIGYIYRHCCENKK